jgi:hypothetical protein
MTNLRQQREAGTASTAHTQPEVIEDLDVTGDDADAIAGGDLKLKLPGVSGESLDSSHHNQIEVGP